MKLNKKLKWTLAALGMTAITTIPMSIVLVSCSKEKEELSINDDFIQDISNPNSTINNVDQKIYEKAKYISENFQSKLNQESTLNFDEIINNWLNNATQKQIEDLLFINFNRDESNFNSYSENNDNEYSKTIYEISNVKYDSKDHIVNFDIIVNMNQFSSFEILPKFIIDTKVNMIAKYSVKNMKLIPKVDNSYNCPLLTCETNNINIELTNMKFKSNFKEDWNKYLELLEYGKENGLSYNDQIIEGQYYEELKKEWNDHKNFYYNYDTTMNNTIGYTWDKNWFNETSKLLHENVFNGFPIGIELDETNSTIIKTKLDTPIFAVAEYNDDESDFNIIFK